MHELERRKLTIMFIGDAGEAFFAASVEGGEERGRGGAGT